MEDPFDGLIDTAHLIVFKAFLKTLVAFNGEVMHSLHRIAFQSDHDGSAEMLDHAVNASEEYHRAARAIHDTLGSVEGDEVTKHTYYTTVFIVSEQLLPAVKVIENEFGDYTPKADGLPYSTTVKGFLESV